MRELEYRGATFFQSVAGGEWTLFTSTCKITTTVDKLISVIEKMDAKGDPDWYCLTSKELQKDLDLHLRDLGLPPFEANSPYNP